MTPAPNPAISQTCTGALNIALVADVSGSIDDGELKDMQTAFRSILSDLLPGTKAEFSLTQFAGEGDVMQPFTTNLTALDKAVNNLRANGFNSRGTNWQDGLTQAASTFNTLNSTAPKLLIIATDGDPTTSINDAITEANNIKAAGVHVLAIGIGTDVNQQNLEYLSGTNVSTNGRNVSINTDVVMSDFSTLGATLLNVIVGGCPSGVGGIGNGGTGAGTNGNGNGSGGTGNGSGGSGTGTAGSGKGDNGAGSGDSAGPNSSQDPTPTPTPSDQPTTETTPTPTPTPTPQQAPSSAPTQTTQPQPQPAPKPTAQGTQTQPPTITPSPFYDGKQYSPGSAADKFATATVPHTSHTGLVITFVSVAVLATGGGSYWYFVWRKRHAGPAARKPAPAKQPSRR